MGEIKWSCILITRTSEIERLGYDTVRHNWIWFLFIPVFYYKS